MKVLRWESPSDWLVACRAARPAMDRLANASDLDHYAGMRAVERGSPSLAKIIDADLSVSANSAGHDAHEWRDDRYIGASVAVGRYAMGLPGCVRRREIQRRDHRHVNVYVSIATSSGVSDDRRAARGAAVIGLLSRLQADGVSVSLFAYSEGAYRDRTVDAAVVVGIPCVPFDLSMLAAMLCDVDVGQGLMMRFEAAAMGDASVEGAWPSFDLASDYRQRMRTALGLAPADIMVGRMHLKDSYLSDPRAWIEAQTLQALDEVSA